MGNTFQVEEPAFITQMVYPRSCRCQSVPQSVASGGGGVGEMDGLPGDESREVDGGLVL